MDHKISPPLLDLDTSDFFHYLISNSTSSAILLLSQPGVILDVNKSLLPAWDYINSNIYIKKYFFRKNKESFFVIQDLSTPKSPKGDLFLVNVVFKFSCLEIPPLGGWG